MTAFLQNLFSAHFAAFLSALVLALVLRALGGAGRSVALSSLGGALGLAVGWLWLRGPPPPVFPDSPQTAAPWVMLLGLVAGFALDLARVGRPWPWMAGVGLACVAIWMALGGPAFPTDGQTVMRAGVWLAGWALVLWRLDALSHSGALAGVMAMMAALGVALVALAVLAPFQAHGVLLVAASAAGFAVAALLRPIAAGASLVLCLGGGLGVLGGALALSERASWAAVLLLLFVLFADGTARLIPLGRGAARRLLEPLALALTCLFPIALALTVAYVARRASGLL